MAQVTANAAQAESNTLHKHLKMRDLVAFGIAAIIGAGIFSTIGQASAQGGPAVIFLFLFTSLNYFSQNTLKLDEVLNNWHQAASDADFESYFALMTNESIFIGTAPGERWSKEAFMAFSKPYFDKGKAWDFKALERNIYLNDAGNFAWFDENLQTNRGTFRGSGILEKIGKEWTMHHYVLSVPIPNDDMNEVVKITRKNDSLFQLKFK